MRILDSTDLRAVDRLLTNDDARDPRVVKQAARIVDDVRRRGDAAVAAWTRRLDAGRAARSGPEILSGAALRRGWQQTPVEVRRALARSAAHLERVAARQVPRGFVVTVAPGIRVEQRVQPLARVGCYVPGGRHPLPSTLLMTVVPARVAGVREIVVVCPRPSPVVLAAALVAGAREVIAVGGAQAIAALAYGTRSIARVDKIVGPGNAWVAAAKALVAGDCAVDLHAGPSEIVVCSDRGRADWIAADLLAQAEHDPSARPLLVTTSRRLARKVSSEVDARLADGAPPTAAQSIAQRGAVIVARNAREAAALVNRIAPEHLMIDDGDDVDRFRAAGTIFVGPWSAEAAGDYCTGSNHVLPTGGAARTRGGLSPADFVRVFTIQTVAARGLRAIGASVVALAEAEGLVEHARSIRLRMQESRTGPGEAGRHAGGGARATRPR